MVVLVGAGPNKRVVFAGFVHIKGAQIKEVAQLLEMLRDKHIALIVNTDGEEALKQI